VRFGTPGERSMRPIVVRFLGGVVELHPFKRPLRHRSGVGEARTDESSLAFCIDAISSCAERGSRSFCNSVLNLVSSLCSNKSIEVIERHSLEKSPFGRNKVRSMEALHLRRIVASQTGDCAHDLRRILFLSYWGRTPPAHGMRREVP